MNASSDFLHDLFDRLSDVALREAGLAAAKALAASERVPTVAAHRWRREFLQLLAPDLPRQRTGIGLATDSLADPSLWEPNNGLVLPRQLRVLQFWQWMERCGYAVLFARDTWAITRSGQARLESRHPCRPGAMERLRSAYADQLGDSLDRLDDALACLEAGLPRPAVVLVGLAYEDLIANVLARTDAKATPKMTAVQRQDALRRKVENAPTSDARTKALIALNVADTIRDARNDAAHKAGGAWDPVDAEELVASGIGAYAKLAAYSLQ